MFVEELGLSSGGGGYEGGNIGGFDCSWLNRFWSLVVRASKVELRVARSDLDRQLELGTGDLHFHGFGGRMSAEELGFHRLTW